MPSSTSNNSTFLNFVGVVLPFSKKFGDSNNGRIGHKALTVVPSPSPKLFALIIGINYYENVRSLRGAVADALEFKRYVEEYLKVPPDRVVTLLNRAASRSAIINALTSLIHDPRIDKGDPILIYYAGHGGETSRSSGDSDQKFQYLVPQDFCITAGQEVPAIPDRTIAALLGQISVSKGDNITVIFDCCHSASGTRQLNASSGATRSVELTSAGDADDLDEDILGQSRALKIFANTGFLRKDLGSHVLLAACSSSESAVENDGRGNFTTALLKLLRTTSPDVLKYSDILMRIEQIPGQNPQCEGLNQKRYLFNSKVSVPSRVGFKVALVDGEFILEGGSIQGISKGAEFTIYPSADITSDKPLGTLVVETATNFYAIMKPLDNSSSITLTESVIAIETKAGEREDLRIYLPENDELAACYEALFQEMQDNPVEFQNITLVHFPEDAHIELVLENNQLAFLVKDDRVTQYGLDRLYYKTNPVLEELAPVIKSAAHYYWKLNRTNPNSVITNNIRMEVYKLEESADLDQPEMTPIGSNLCQDDVVDFVVDEDAAYGVKLINDTPYDLFPNLYYFDNSDLSIGSYYQLPTAGNYALDVPLKKNGGILTVGFGDGGMPPFAYFLRAGQNLDVGFLKLFVSTKYVDLSGIPQLSPFEESRSLESLKKPEADTWGTLLVPVLQRRYPRAIEGQTHCPRCGFDDMPSNIIVNRHKGDIESLRREMDVMQSNASATQRQTEQRNATLQSKLEELQAQNAQLKELLELAKQVKHGIPEPSSNDRVLSSLDVQEHVSEREALHVDAAVASVTEQHKSRILKSDSTTKDKSKHFWSSGLKQLQRVPALISRPINHGPRRLREDTKPH